MINRINPIKTDMIKRAWGAAFSDEQIDHPTHEVPSEDDRTYQCNDTDVMVMMSKKNLKVLIAKVEDSICAEGTQTKVPV